MIAISDLFIFSAHHTIMLLENSPLETLIRRLLAAIFVLLVAAAGFSLHRYLQIDQRLDIRFAENALWSATQNEVELAQFITVLSELSVDPFAVSRAKIIERYDSLLNHLAVYRDTPLARTMLEHPDNARIIERLREDLHAIESDIFGPPERIAFAAAQARLGLNLEPLHRLTLAWLEADRVDRQQLTQAMWTAKQQMALFAMVALAVLATLFGQLLLSENRARQRVVATLAAQRQAEAAWRQLEEAIENVNEGFVLYDAEDRLVRCNQKYREVYSISAAKLQPGSTFETILRYGAARGQYDMAGTDPERWVSERLRRRDTIAEPFEQFLGDGRWLMVSDRRLRDGGRVGIRTDITEIKRHLAELEATRRNLRAQTERMSGLVRENRRANQVLNDAIESIGEGFVLYDAEDRIVTCNSRFKSLFPKISALLLPGLSFDAYLEAVQAAGHLNLGEDPAKAITERKRRRRNGASVGFVEHLADGRWLQVSNRATRNGGVVTVFNDITELKTRELALIEAQQSLEGQAQRMAALAELAEAASRSKSDFLAMVSHEIRTPMNAVLGLSALLAESRLEDEQAKFVDGIVEAGTHLLGLINNILDFSRLEANKITLALAPASISGVIESALRIVAVLAEKKRLRLVVALDPALPDCLMLDSARLSQILINLIGNAIKFTPSGEVRISARASEITETGAQIELCVKDSGIGIDAALKARLFSPFERGGAGHAEAGGTGLGLAITRQLVGLMGGSIGLDEMPGPGSSFTIRLPCLRAKAEQAPLAPRAAQAASQEAPLDILVAEDTPASQLVIRTMLERRGHRVLLVENGAAAVEAATQEAFDLALLDVQMPVLSGLDAAMRIRALPGPAAQMPIIALSAQAFDTDRQRAIDAGFNEHLAKPIRPAALDSLLMRISSGKISAPCAVSVPPSVQNEANPMPGPPAFTPDLVEALPELALDWAMLAELRAICGLSSLHSMLRIAIQTIRTEAGTIHEALVSSDFDAARRAAHKLAGILGQYGAREAGDRAIQFEIAPPSALPLLAEPLQEEIRAAILALETYQRNLHAEIAQSTMPPRWREPEVRAS